MTVKENNIVASLQKSDKNKAHMHAMTSFINTMYAKKRHKWFRKNNGQ